MFAAYPASLLVLGLAFAQATLACPGAEHAHDHAHAPVKRAFPPFSLPVPPRPLVWGDVNVIHTTDTHGWLLGHQKLSEPEPNYSGDLGDFASFVRSSILRQTTHKATCQTCKNFATFETRRSISSRDLPPVLALNAMCFSEETHKLWRDTRRQTFLKPTIEVRGHIEGMDDPEATVYELRVRRFHFGHGS